MLAQCRRRWATIEPTLAQRIVFAAYYAHVIRIVATMLW